MRGRPARSSPHCARSSMRCFPARWRCSRPGACGATRRTRAGSSRASARRLLVLFFLFLVGALGRRGLDGLGVVGVALGARVGLVDAPVHLLEALLELVAGALELGVWVGTRIGLHGDHLPAWGNPYAPAITENVADPLTEPGAVRIRRALLSVSDKTGLADFARGLVELGVELVSTGG